MVIESRTDVDLPHKKTKEILSSETLRISTGGIFVRGQPIYEQARIYEDMCAKRARIEHPGMFIISPPVVDRMARAKGSIFMGPRPDALILQKIDCNTFLWGMQEYKSGGKGSGYKVVEKLDGFYTVLTKLANDSGAISRDLLDSLDEESYSRIPIDINQVHVPNQVQVDFITASAITYRPDKFYPGMNIVYKVITAPIHSVPRFLLQEEHEVFSAG